LPYLGDGANYEEVKSLFKRDAQPDMEVDDQFFVNLVKATKAKNGDDENVFKAVKGAVSSNISSKQLKKKFEKLTVEHEPVAGDEIRPEVLAKYFCRRCLIFGCQIHGEDDQPKRKPAPNVDGSVPASTESCGKDCWMNEKTAGTSRVKRWNKNDHKLFENFIKIFPNDFCIISHAIAGKTCREIKQHAEKMKMDLPAQQEAQSDDKHKKKTSTAWRDPKSNRDVTVRHSYKPCGCKGSCKDDCQCYSDDNFCEKFCGCPEDCANRFPGCKCTSSCKTSQCGCFFAHRECDPDLCGCKHSGDDKICKNRMIQLRQKHNVKIAQSNVAGWGLFAVTPIEKDDLISEYVGEIISIEETERRGVVYDAINHNFLFELNEESTIDATRKGNKIRFANHAEGNHANCQPRQMKVIGDDRVGIYAKKSIAAGEELLFDYGKSFAGKMSAAKVKPAVVKKAKQRRQTQR
jgi:hypothetical protein